MTDFEKEKMEFEEELEYFLSNNSQEVELKLPLETILILTNINDENDLTKAKIMLDGIKMVVKLFELTNNGELKVDIEDNFYVDALIKVLKANDLDKISKYLIENCGYLFTDMFAFAMEDMEEVYEYVCNKVGMESDKKINYFKYESAIQTLGDLTAKKLTDFNDETLELVQILSGQIDTRLKEITDKKQYKLIKNRK